MTFEKNNAVMVPSVRSFLTGLSIFLLVNGLCSGAQEGSKRFQEWVNSKKSRPTIRSFQPKASSAKRPDVYWSGQPISYNLYPRPGLPYPHSPNRVKVPLYPGSSAWTWGDRFQVGLPDNNAFKFRPLGSPLHRPNGQYHQNGIFVKHPEINVPPPINLHQNDYNSIVGSLNPSSFQYTSPNKAHVSSQPYGVSTHGPGDSTSTKSTPKPVATYNRPYQFLQVQDNLQQISVESSGSNKIKDDDTIASSLTVLDPDDSSELTLLHGTILVSSNQKRPVPQPLYRPSGYQPSSNNPVSQEKPNSPTNVFVTTNSNSDFPLKKNVSVNLLANVAESGTLINFINLNSANLIKEQTITEPSGSSHESLPSLQGEDVDILKEFFTSSDILTDQQTEPVTTQTPNTSTGPITAFSELTTPDSSVEDLPLYHTLLIPSEEEPSATEEPFVPDIQALFASDPAASPSLISSQIIANVPVIQPLNVAAATGAGQPLSFQTSQIPTPLASNVLSATSSSGLSTGTLLQFAAQIALPVVMFFGIMFMLVTLTSRRRRRRDLLTPSARTLLKIPDGFPVELLGR